MSKPSGSFSNRKAKDVGALYLKDYENIEAKALKNQGHESVSSHNVHASSNLKIPAGLKGYALRLWKRRNGFVQEYDSTPSISNPQANLPIDPAHSREIFYLFKPNPGHNQLIDGLYFLNYIFRSEIDLRIYRTAFFPKREMNLQDATEFSKRKYILTLASSIKIHGQNQNIYYNPENKEISVGDRYRPRNNKLEFITKVDWNLS